MYARKDMSRPKTVPPLHLGSTRYNSAYHYRSKSRPGTSKPCELVEKYYKDNPFLKRPETTLPVLGRPRKDQKKPVIAFGQHFYPQLKKKKKSFTLSEDWTLSPSSISSGSDFIEDIVDLPKESRFSAGMSNESKYALLKGYDEVICGYIKKNHTCEAFKNRPETPTEIKDCTIPNSGRINTVCDEGDESLDSKFSHCSKPPNTPDGTNQSDRSNYSYARKKVSPPKKSVSPKPDVIIRDKSSDQQSEKTNLSHLDSSIKEGILKNYNYKGEKLNVLKSSSKLKDAETDTLSLTFNNDQKQGNETDRTDQSSTASDTSRSKKNVQIEELPPPKLLKEPKYDYYGYNAPKKGYEALSGFHRVLWKEDLFSREEKNFWPDWEEDEEEFVEYKPSLTYKQLATTYRIETGMDILDTLKSKHGEQCTSTRHQTRIIRPLRHLQEWRKVWNSEFK